MANAGIGLDVTTAETIPDEDLLDRVHARIQQEACSTLLC